MRVYRKLLKERCPECDERIRYYRTNCIKGVMCPKCEREIWYVRGMHRYNARELAWLYEKKIDEGLSNTQVLKIMMTESAEREMNMIKYY